MSRKCRPRSFAGVENAIDVSHTIVRDKEAAIRRREYVHRTAPVGTILAQPAAGEILHRAGLTPKFKDVETLVDILTYEMGPPPIIAGDAAEVVYQTPVPEFRVSRLRMQPGQEREESTGGGPAVLLVTKGDVLIGWEGSQAAFRRGQSVLIPALLEALSLMAETPVEFFKVTVPLQRN